jgi:hypothetical protein
MRRRKPGVERRRRLRTQQGGLCYWCGLPMQVGANGSRFRNYPWATTLEHLLPRGHPDHSQPWAVVGAHQLCNSLREQVDWDDFLTFVRGPRLASLYRGSLYRTGRRDLTRQLMRQALRDIETAKELH